MKEIQTKIKFEKFGRVFRPISSKGYDWVFYRSILLSPQIKVNFCEINENNKKIFSRLIWFNLFISFFGEIFIWFY